VNGVGFKFLNNTIINPALDGIRLYADQVTMNTIENNIIINAGDYNLFGYPRPKTDAYVYLLNKDVKVTMKNNWFSQDINTVKFANPAGDNYALTILSLNLLNKGISVSGFGVTFDMAKDPPDDDTLAGALLGPTGNLKAPTFRKGTTLVVGFSEEAYKQVLG